MRWPEAAVRVTVPATSANLGPGFDALGLALGLRDEVEARLTTGGLTIEVVGEGADLVAGAGEAHLVLRAMRAAFDGLGVGQPPGIALRCVNRIPHGRGLGSSAAAIVAGILAARALAGTSAPAGASGPAGDFGSAGASGTEDEAGAMHGAAGAADVLALASEIEGHPDNVAPCLYGGLTIVWLADGPGAPAGTPPPVTGSASAGAASAAPAGKVPAGTVPAGTVPAGTVSAGTVSAGRVRVVRLEPLRRITPVAVIAPAAVSTEVARGLLPERVPHADAARNAGRAALLVAALTACPELLLDATEDRLQQDYRAPAMPGTRDLVARLRAAGIPAVVSGAGPSVLAFLLTPADPAASLDPAASQGAGGAGWPAAARGDLRALDSTVRETGIEWRVSPLDVERHGASVALGVPSTW